MLEKTFGDSTGAGDVLLGAITAVEVDTLGRVYVLDAPNGGRQAIVAFSTDGTVRWTADVQGRAPGELRYVYGFAYDGDSLLVVGNQLGTRLDRFSLNGAYVDSRPTREVVGVRAMVAGFLDSGRLALWWSIPGAAGAAVGVIDTDAGWAAVDTFTVDLSGSLDIPDGSAIPPVVTTIGESVVVGHVGEYGYSWLTADGTRARTYTRPEVPFTPPGIATSELGSSVLQLSKMFEPVPVGNRYVLGGGTWPRRRVDASQRISAQLRGEGGKLERTTSLDLFDATTGTLLHSIDAGAVGIKRLLASDERGRIYAELVGDIPVLGRFRIEGTSIRDGE